MFKVIYDICGEWHEEEFDNWDDAFFAFSKGCDVVDEHESGFCQTLSEGNKVMYYEFPFKDEEEEDFNEDFDDCDYEMGFDPYEGCYTYDC